MWQTESLRLTIFTLLPINIEEINWWNDVVGSNPDMDNIIRHKGERMQEGSHLNGRIRLHVVPGRIDWILFPVTGVDGEVPANLGAPTEKFTEFKSLLINWLNDCLNIQRLAIGVIIHSVQDDHQSAYRFLDSYLPSVELDADGSTDFLYQINRSRETNIPELGQFKINRLTRWQAVKGGLIVNREGVQEEKKFYASKCDIDLSTDAVRTEELPRSSLSPIFDIFESFSNEIIEHGDIA